jgi:UDP-glucose 4-epimerase
MNWVITGGCGFIGLSLIKQLIKETSNHIRIVDNLTTGTKKDLSEICDFSQTATNIISDFKHVELITGDILDENLAIKVTKNADVIVHLAANTGVGPSVENPRADLTANVVGTFNYLEAARINNVRKFVFASSGAPAGEVEPPIHEELPPHPVSPYGASKLAGEGYCSAYYKSFNVQTVILRFGNVYGPGSLHKSSIVAKFIRQAINKEILEIYGDGSQTRDFIYIDDLINALRLAVMKENIGGETFQIASNQETTVGQMTNTLVQILQDNGISDINVANGEMRLGDVKRNYSDTSKARLRLGWQAVMGQKEGLEKTVRSFLK